VNASPKSFAHAEYWKNGKAIVDAETVRVLAAYLEKESKDSFLQLLLFLV